MTSARSAYWYSYSYAFPAFVSPRIFPVRPFFGGSMSAWAPASAFASSPVSELRSVVTSIRRVSFAAVAACLHHVRSYELPHGAAVALTYAGAVLRFVQTCPAVATRV